MDHAEAITKGAVERYQLGELSPQEIDEFETHFFECAQCAEELRAAAIFEENAKAVFLEDRRNEAAVREPRAKYERANVSWWALFWRNPWSAAPSAAAFALLSVVGFQARMMHSVLAPQAVASYVLLAPARGSEEVEVEVEVPKQNKFYMLYIESTWSHPEYVWTVRDQKGSVRWSQRLAAPPAGKTIEILLSRNQLPSGRYTVILHSANAAGKPETELAQYSLTLKLD